MMRLKFTAHVMVVLTSGGAVVEGTLLWVGVHALVALHQQLNCRGITAV